MQYLVSIFLLAYLASKFGLVSIIIFILCFIIGIIVFVAIQQNLKQTKQPSHTRTPIINNANSTHLKNGITSFHHPKLLPNPEPIEENFWTPLPKGYQIFVKYLEIEGVSYRKEDVLKFVKSVNQTLVLEREPTNEFDSNAIKIIGQCYDGNFFLGYVSKGIAKQIIETNLFEHIKPRLVRIYVSRSNFIEIRYQIIGLKFHKIQFDDYVNNQPMTNNQKDYCHFFKLLYSKKTTYAEAKKMIENDRKIRTENELSEWHSFEYILDDFNDKDFREEYGIKKVNKKDLLQTIDSLIAKGKSYKYLKENVDEIVDEILFESPHLKRSEKFI